ncbi:MAG: glycosyltransferase [Firmicutes bacterium]|nr:glycosyltransferase [Bacillota bacterium]
MKNKLSTYKNVHACTIIAKNYLAAARVVAESFLALHEGATFTTLVLDDRAGTIDTANEPFRVYGLDDIGLSKEEIEEMTAIYTVMELATAVKPWLLETLLNEAEAVLYLDPDIKVYSALDELFLPAMNGKIVLTPHATRPMPRDNKTTDETAVLASGIYNLGFVGVGNAKESLGDVPTTKDFLHFWQERLRRECYVDIANMRFVDQRWIDFVPGIYEVAIIKNPVYNVAYWNLDHREIGFSDNTYTVNGKPLGFFHFSGYNPHRPHLLSKHQGVRPRILLSENPYLKELCDQYGEDLLEHGFDTTTREPYLYDRLKNGIKLDPFSRKLYRDALLRSKNQTERTGRDDGEDSVVNVISPFAGNGDQFIMWLNEPPEELSFDTSHTGKIRLYNGAHPSRYLLAIHQARADLQAAFPDPLGNDQYRLVEWAAHEAALGRLDNRLVPGSLTARELARGGDSAWVDHEALSELENNPKNSGSAHLAGNITEKDLSIDKEDLPNDLIPGMRVTGYFQAETGTGEHARLVLSTIEKAGITAGAYIDNNMISRQKHSFSFPDRSDLNVNVICINADQLPYFHQRTGDGFFKDRYNIGLWAWELEEFPEHFAKAAVYLDEIWANSSFTQKAISQVTDRLVFPFPLPIKAPVITKEFDRKRLGIGSEPMFLFCFDLMSVMERKNPLGLIEAFSMAFKDGEGPKLVIKAVGGQHKVEDLEKLKYVASKRKDVIIFDSYLSFEENASLINACDCYVSLHRSEGFGLTMAEAMTLGKPVIATGYSGNLDFMTQENSFLVPFDYRNIQPGCDPYPTSMRWADPNLEIAAAYMRDVVEKPDLAKSKGELAKQEVLRLHGIEARAQFVKGRFDFAQAQLLSRGNQMSIHEINNIEQLPADPPLIAMAKSSPDLNTGSNKGQLAKVYRKIIYKALRHHDEQQKTLDIAMAAGIEHVARLITEYGQEISSLHNSIHNLQTHLNEDTTFDDQQVTENSRHVKSNLNRIKDLEIQLTEIRDLIYGQKKVLQSQDNKFNASVKEILTLRDAVDALEANFEYLGEEVKLIAGPKSRRQIHELEEALQQLKNCTLSSVFTEPNAFIKGIDGFSTLGFDRNLLKTAKSYLEVIDKELKTTVGKSGRSATTALSDAKKADKIDLNSLWNYQSLKGSKSEIIARQTAYLKILANYNHIINLGCGQGEMLSLLREYKVDAVGVDRDQTAVKYCQSLGLDVTCADLSDYLASLSTNLQSSIAATNIVEYLAKEDLTSILTKIHDLLSSGYLLLLEARNPHQPRSFINSWADPQLNRPVFPEVLLTECYAAGFERAEVFFPTGTGDYRLDLSEQDYYAVIAYK